MLVTGAKSRRTSNGWERWVLGFTANEAEVTSSVWPSAGARATISAPMLPLAPGRLSTTNGWPSWLDSCWPTMRATESGAPAPKPTTMRTGREGQVGAVLAAVAAATTPDAPDSSAMATMRAACDGFNMILLGLQTAGALPAVLPARGLQRMPRGRRPGAAV